MADGSAIEWTEATWNPVTGCTKVSPGCDHCYAERITERFHGKGSFAVVQRDEGKLYLPLKWRRPRRVFVNSMSDLFHDNVPAPFIGRVFRVMAQTPQHTYQILTKRHGRMRAMLSADGLRQMVADITDVWPLPNVWGGVSVEDQHWAGIRIPALMDTPLAVRWISLEPLLGPVDLSPWLLRPYERQQGGYWDYAGADVFGEGKTFRAANGLDWVVVGGESGPGARPMHPDWARSLRDQCVAAGVPFFFKQWGEFLPPVPPSTTPVRVGKKHAGRVLDGQTWDEYPAVVS